MAAVIRSVLNRKQDGWQCDGLALDRDGVAGEQSEAVLDELEKRYAGPGKESIYERLLADALIAADGSWHNPILVKEQK